VVEKVFEIVALPEASSTIVWFGPLFIVYVTIAFGVPVNVIVEEPPLQIGETPEIETTGGGTIVMLIVPVAGAEQEVAPLTVTFTSS
jgi:hypothetical protein